jgi:hypothetical protein
MDALALVVCIVIFVSATVMFFCGALIVVLRVRRHRWAATRWALQQARRESEGIPPRSYIRAAVLPMLVGVAIGGVIVLSTYLYVVYQSTGIVSWAGDIPAGRRLAPTRVGDLCG